MRKWFPNRLLAGCAAVLLIAGIAWASQSTITVLDSTGATKTYVVTADGSGNFLANIVLCDFSAGANCATVNSSHQLGVIEANSAATLAAIQDPIPDCGATPCANNIGVVYQKSQYPAGATPLTASATGTTGATTATLAGTSGKTTYICGYSIRANANAATTVTNTITGVITATLSSIMWVAPAASGIGIDEQIFSPCIPASATNTPIAIVSGAPGTGGAVSSKGWGYQL